MNSDQTRPVTERTAAPTMISPDRVTELLSTFQALRERGRTLLASLRASVFEMQAQRQRLRQDGATNGHPHEPADQVTRRLREEFGMTRREVDVALLLAQGSSNTAVAYRLGISRIPRGITPSVCSTSSAFTASRRRRPSAAERVAGTVLPPFSSRTGSTEGTLTLPPVACPHACLPACFLARPACRLTSHPRMP